LAPELEFDDGVPVLVDSYPLSWPRQRISCGSEGPALSLDPPHPKQVLKTAARRAISQVKRKKNFFINDLRMMKAMPLNKILPWKEFLSTDFHR